MRLKFIRIISLLLINMSVLFAGVASFEITNPVNGKISKEGYISVVVKPINSEITAIEIIDDKNTTKKISINEIRTHYCKNITLNLGQNNIKVKVYKGSELLEKKELSVYYTSAVHKKYKYPPEEFVEQYFHSDSNEKVCAKCHDMSVNEVKGIAFEKIEDSNCYQCHNKVTEKQHGHAPSVNWLCTSCHTGKTSLFNKRDAGKSKYLVVDPVSQECFKCHDKQKDEWNKKRFQHEPVESGRCNKCHNSHSSKEQFYLRKSVWELCTSCHKDKVEGMHIVKTFANVMHPTHGKKDPSRQGKDLSCISCHNPHASDGPSLLKSTSAMGLCVRCHKK